MFCPNCGNSIPDDSQFCPFCGCNLNEFRSGSNTNIIQQEEKPSKEPRRAGKNKWLLAGIILGILFAAVLTCGIIFYLTMSKVTGFAYEKGPDAVGGKEDFVIENSTFTLTSRDGNEKKIRIIPKEDGTFSKWVKNGEYAFVAEGEGYNSSGDVVRIDRGQENELNIGLMPTATSVVFEHIRESDREAGIYTGVNDSGKRCWKIETANYVPIVEYNTNIGEIGPNGNDYFYIEDGRIHRIKISDGSEVWVTDFQINTTQLHAFDEMGNLYFTFSWDPALMVVDSNGKITAQIDSLGMEQLWLSDFEYHEGKLYFYYGNIYEINGYDSLTTIVVDCADFSYTEEMYPYLEGDKEEAAYVEFLSDQHYGRSAVEMLNHYYSIVDLDQDGIQELLIHGPHDTQSYYVFVYEYKENQVVEKYRYKYECPYGNIRKLHYDSSDRKIILEHDTDGMTYYTYADFENPDIERREIYSDVSDKFDSGVITGVPVVGFEIENYQVQLSEAEIAAIRLNIGVPEDVVLSRVEASQPYYWEAGMEWIMSVNLYEYDQMVAGASFDSQTLVAARNIYGYTPPKVSAAIKKPTSLKSPETGSAGYYVWDTVYLGTYPQAEVVSDGNYWPVRKASPGQNACIIDAELYYTLQNSPDWENDQLVINGMKYKRVTSDQATNVTDLYSWGNGYHYFSCDVIEWRVLAVSDSEALLMSEKVLTDKRINNSESNVWASSDIRAWLNGEFYNEAFTAEEQAMIVSSVISTEGSGDTEDKVYLLSYQEALNPAFGFCVSAGNYDYGKEAVSTTYAKAMGVWVCDKQGYIGNTSWWLRTPGQASNKVYGVYSYGNLYETGYVVNTDGDGVRPVIKIRIS